MQRHHGGGAMPQTDLKHQISLDKVIKNAENDGFNKPFQSFIHQA